MFAVTARSPALVEDTPIGTYRSLYMDLRLMAAGGAPDVATLEVPANHPAAPALLRQGTGPGHQRAGIVVRRAGGTQVLFSGRIVDVDDQQSPGGVLSVICAGDDSILSREISFPSPGTDVPSGSTGTMAAAYDTRTGHGETVLLAFISANIGPGALTRRQYPWLSVPGPHTPTALGSSGTWNARLGDLLTLCRRIALAAGIVFRLVQAGQGVIAVQVWAPATAPAATFSPQTGSLTDVHYRWSESQTTEAIIGGAGSGAGRILTRRDAAGVTAGLLRGTKFVDQQSTSGLADLQQAGDETLAEDGPTAGIQFTAVDRPGRRFGLNYQLGDIGTAVDMRGVSVNDVIQRVEVRHEADSDSGGMRDPVINPTVGAVNAEDSTALVKRVLRLIDAKVRS